jgi:nitrogen fixation NifU-like protein
MDNQIYRENIMDHYKNPRNFGKIEHNHSSNGNNELCGDNINFYVNKKNNKIENISFEGEGCAICIASASMISEELKNENISKIKKINKEDVIDMLGIKLSPIRIKCALLPLYTIKNIE